MDHIESMYGLVQGQDEKQQVQLFLPVVPQIGATVAFPIRGTEKYETRTVLGVHHDRWGRTIVTFVP